MKQENDIEQELEKMMNTWKLDQGTVLDPTQYLRKLNRRLWADRSSILLMMSAALFLIYGAYVKPMALTFTVVVYFVPYFLWGSYKIWRRTKSEIRTAGSTTKEYLENQLRNLELAENENRWERRILPPSIAAAGIIMVWSSEVTGWIPWKVVVVLGCCVPAFAYSIWAAFHRKPARHKAERESIEAAYVSFVMPSTDDA